MCCFSSAVEVGGTSIFARDAGGGRQFLAYAMEVENEGETAMVLPLPVAKGAGDQALTFVDLSACPDFFANLAEMMKRPGAGVLLGGAEPLAVHAVGAFEASYVPTIADFSRLDARFRIPAATWEKLPACRDYGFAVFRLKPGNGLVHPMAFSFPRADQATLFFPTVHIHDGTVHEKADFHHTLYAQFGGRHVRDSHEWSESPGIPKGSAIDLTGAKGIIAAD